MAQKVAVQNYLVENMAVNNLWGCNMAEMKCKVENELPVWSMATNVETSDRNYKHWQMIHALETGLDWF